MIRIPQVRVVDEDGSQLGVMPTAQALAMAQERGYDLVEVAPMAAPPVVRFLDFGQFKYEATKREKEAKRKQRSVTFKEVRLKPKIATGDFDTRVRRAIQFLEEGDRLKVAVQFRGRELTHPEIGRNLLAKFSERIKDHGVVERAPLLEGKSMHITVASTHKPKVIEGPKHEDGVSAIPVDGDAAPSGPTPTPAAATTKAPTAAPATTEAPAKAEAAPAEAAPAKAKASAPAESSVAKAPAKPPATRAKATPATGTKPAPAAAAVPIAATAAATNDSPPSAVRAAPKRAARTTRAAEPGAKAAATSTAKSAATTGE
jgi:translation initiation factor IF-3